MQVNVRLESGALLQYLTRIPSAIPKGVARGLNKVGEPTANKFVRSASKILGIGKPPSFSGWKNPLKTAQHRSRASSGRLRYLFVGFGGPISLIHFRARETRAGVVAYPMNQRRLYRHHFIKGGHFPRRKIGKLTGKVVWKPTLDSRKWGRKFGKSEGGPSFPDAFGQPEAVRLWEAEGGQKAMAAIYRELDAILKGHAPP